jgi:hypothetical protein
MKNSIELATWIKSTLAEDQKGFIPPKMQQFDSMIVAVFANSDEKKLYTIKVTELVSSVNLNEAIAPVANISEKKEN